MHVSRAAYLTAIHEASHAAAIRAAGGRITRICLLEPGAGGGCRVEYEWPRPWPDERWQITILLAGHEGERIACCERGWSTRLSEATHEQSTDRARAQGMLARIRRDAEWRQLDEGERTSAQAWLTSGAAELLDDPANWHAVKVIARALLESSQGWLSGDQVHAIIATIS